MKKRLLTPASKILVLGGTGLVGSAIVRELRGQGQQTILHPTSKELNLLSQDSTLKYFETFKPDYVFNSAAKVGGIVANNTYRADFIIQNLQIQNNVFEAAFKNDVKKMIFMGSSCIYPKNAEQPIREESLLTSPLESTNEPYAIAKIAGLKTAENFNRQYGCQYYSLMPTNLYGVNDNFDLVNSHVIPGLMHRMHLAKVKGDSAFSIWGTGKPRREFLYVDDLAAAAVHVMNESNLTEYFYNVGYGEDHTIVQIAEMVKDVVGYQGELIFDTSKPDGTFQKLLNSDRIQKLGWRPKVSLAEGLAKTYDYFKKNIV